MMKFIEERPASRFGEAYPVGDGWMGAVVYGSFPVERITVTEHTFFSGKQSDDNYQPEAPQVFQKMRELLEKGKYQEAHEEAEKFHGIRNSYGTHLPAGNLEICLEDKCNRKLSWKEISAYERSLDIEQGIASVFARIKGCAIRMESFASHPDHVLIWHLESEEVLNVAVRWYPWNGHGSAESVKNGLDYSAKALEPIHCDETCGVKLSGRCRVQTDGLVHSSHGILHIRKAKEITLYLICETDYTVWPRSLDDRMDEILQKSYETIRESHVEDVYSRISRVKLSLDREYGLEVCRLFQYGRYLLLCSSREDSFLPAHLQGIWNDEVACRIGWTCDMHLDVNTQMNYWPSDVTNLPETLPPLLNWLEKLACEGKRNAKRSYGLNGWCVELVSNAWCYAAPYWSASLSPYPTGGIWLLSQFWEYCKYFEDLEIEKRVFTLTQEAVRFFVGYVFETEDGSLSTGPSISPENSFLYEGDSYQISNGCTYEYTLIRELFRNYIRMSQRWEYETDKELLKQTEDLVFRIPEPRIMQDGTIAEWSHDFPASDSQHRHISHLIGLFPFAQITPLDTPVLAAAAKKTIERKLTPYEQWEDTGWARSMLLLYSARLQEAEQAWFHLRSMIKELQEPNGMIYHPSTRGTMFGDDFDHVYELDGNTGLTSGVAEMLLQSHGGIIYLLPAVPSEWSGGYVNGLRARGGILVDIRWQDNQITEYVLYSEKTQKCQVRFGECFQEVLLSAGQPYCWKKA